MKTQQPAAEPTSIKPLPRPAPVRPSKPQPDSPGAAPDAGDPPLQGEGNYTAARRHRKSAEAFVASGQVEKAAHDAAPQTAEEAEQLRAAEKKGRAPAKR